MGAFICISQHAAENTMHKLSRLHVQYICATHAIYIKCTLYWIEQIHHCTAILL